MQEHGARLLVCAATLGELETFWRDDERATFVENDAFAAGGGYLVTGVGIPLALARVLGHIQQFRPTRILNIGIAGAYPNSGLEIGDLVAGQGEVYGDVGFELPQEPGFLPLADSSFDPVFYGTVFPLTLESPYVRDGIRPGRGCAVNTCTGTARTGYLREKLFQAQFETMEGAAVAQVGRQENIPVTEVRAISNIASDRAMHPENIRRALSRLRAYLQACRDQEEQR